MSCAVKRVSKQAGFSAIELIVTLGILVLLTAAVVFTFNADNSKATTLFNTAQEYANAMKRARVDLACYPTKMAALFDSAQANTSFCGLNLTPQWRGRYAETAPADATGNVLLNQIAPNVVISVVTVADAAGTHYRINASAIPNDILTRAVDACNGGPGVVGRCFGAAGAGGTGAFQLEFDLL